MCVLRRILGMKKFKKTCLEYSRLAEPRPYRAKKLSKYVLFVGSDLLFCVDMKLDLSQWGKKIV